MILAVRIEIDLGDAFTPYDRLALSDHLLGEIRSLINKKKNMKLVSAKGEIVKEEKNAE